MSVLWNAVDGNITVVTRFGDQRDSKSFLKKPIS